MIYSQKKSIPMLKTAIFIFANNFPVIYERPPYILKHPPYYTLIHIFIYEMYAKHVLHVYLCVSFYENME